MEAYGRAIGVPQTDLEMFGRRTPDNPDPDSLRLEWEVESLNLQAGLAPPKGIGR